MPPACPGQARTAWASARGPWTLELPRGSFARVLVPALLLAAGLLPAAAPAAPARDVARWERQARGVTILRDDWGIAHVYGKTDADAVLGMEYAQAEDDFNRVETNYLGAMGRMAEAEADSAIYQDLRMKLFVDPDSMQALYRASPPWLQKLMNAFADGLNFYLYKHPEVKPRVLARFEPWMALTFTEGSIGGDIERVSLPELAAFYGDSEVKPRVLARFEPWMALTFTEGSIGGDIE